MDMLLLTAVLAERWLLAFLVDLARYVVGAGLVSFVLFGIFGRFSSRHRIQSRRATRDDIRREITHSVITVMVYATVALVTIALIDRGAMRLYMDPGQYGWLYLMLTVPLMLILHDAYFYWVHRLMHHPRIFHRVHRLHHLSRTPTTWAAYSFSVWEAFAMTIFVPVVMAVIPIHPIALFVFLAIMIVRNAMGHSGVEFHPIGWVDSPLDALTTVTHHDLHHQKFHGNYGLYFTWWDRWMGTELPGYKAAFRRAATPAEVVPSTHEATEAGGR